VIYRIATIHVTLSDLHRHPSSAVFKWEF